jgi:hypothetical protein
MLFRGPGTPHGPQTPRPTCLHDAQFAAESVVGSFPQVSSRGSRSPATTSRENWWLNGFTQFAQPCGVARCASPFSRRAHRQTSNSNAPRNKTTGQSRALFLPHCETGTALQVVATLVLTMPKRCGEDTIARGEEAHVGLGGPAGHVLGRYVGNG